MATAHPNDESHEGLEGRANGLRARHRLVLLAASAGLVIGSAMVVVGPTAAAAKTTLHNIALGTSGPSQIQRGVLQLAEHTGNVMAPLGTKATAVATKHESLPKLGADRGAGSHTAAPVVPFPTVNCPGSGCDAISGNGGANTNRIGLSATANDGLYNEDVEPPDQGLCAGNGYVVEDINIGEVQVFNSRLQPVTGITSLNSLMGLTTLGYGSGGDIMCEYDADNGGHWFITEIVSTTPSAFTGCFAGITEGCREGLAVSTTNNPQSTSWNIYFIDPNTMSPGDPGAGHLLNDYGKMGMTRDALLFFYDEFNLSGSLPTCPAFGCEEFNGAQEIAIQKKSLELGFINSNFVHENMGTDPYIQPPDGDCDNGPTAGVTCWYQVIPATSPSGEFDNNYGGTGFMAGNTDFNSFTFGTGNGDNRAAIFYWEHLSALNSANCGACGEITFGGQLFTGLESYTDDGQACLASAGDPCGLAPQRLGNLDLGTYCETEGLASAQPCPEQGIATNGDGVTQLSYGGGQLWFAVSTLINENFGSSTETHIGAAYWVISTSSFVGATHLLTLSSQGYVAAAHEDLAFPTLVGAPGGWGGLMSFTLSGNGGPSAADGGGFFPSSAYGRVTAWSDGLTGSTMHVTALGRAPQDGFTEYQGLPGPIRPRWGDYGAAVFVPGVGFYFASEYIQYPNCNPAYWLNVDPSCGGTRDEFANFGTSINSAR